MLRLLPFVLGLYLWIIITEEIRRQEPCSRNTCLRIGIGEQIPCFASLVCVAFALVIKLSCFYPSDSPPHPMGE